jgi:hypothetical protein
MKNTETVLLKILSCFIRTSGAFQPIAKLHLNDLNISENIAKSYLLVNDGANTNLKNGYFHNYENNIK